MKWLKRLGLLFAVIVVLFSLFSLVGSVIISYHQTGQPPGDPGPTPAQIVQQGYLETLGRLPSGVELQSVIQKIQADEINNGDQLRKAIKSLEENK